MLDFHDKVSHCHIEKSLPEYADMRHTRHLNIATTLLVFRRAAVRFLSFPWVGII